MSRKKKNDAKEKVSTRQLMGIADITDHALVTGYGELVFFMIKPTNISVLSENSVGARIYALMIAAITVSISTVCSRKALWSFGHSTASCTREKSRRTFSSALPCPRRLSTSGRQAPPKRSLPTKNTPSVCGFCGSV